MFIYFPLPAQRPLPLLFFLLVHDNTPHPATNQKNKSAPFGARQSTTTRFLSPLFKIELQRSNSDGKSPPARLLVNGKHILHPQIPVLLLSPFSFLRRGFPPPFPLVVGGDAISPTRPNRLLCESTTIFPPRNSLFSLLPYPFLTPTDLHGPSAISHPHYRDKTTPFPFSFPPRLSIFAPLDFPLLFFSDRKNDLRTPSSLADALDSTKKESGYSFPPNYLPLLPSR